MSKKKYIFSDKEYNSGDGMLTSVWGPPLWHTLHTISFNYPVKPSSEDKENYMNYFKSLGNVLPCRYCRENYKENLKVIPLRKKVFKNRETLSRWVYQLHELVNKNLGKKSGLKYEDVRERYEHFRARCLTNNETKKPKTKKEKGCTKPLYGVKSKCVLNIVPKNSKKKSLNIDKKCKIRRDKDKK